MTNIAQIGIGYWGPNLLRNLVSNKNCEVSRAVDLSPERREYVRRLYPTINVSDNLEDIYNDPKVEAVVIATPVATHFDLAVRALLAGKHILVEKPLATKVFEVDEIARLGRGKAFGGHGRPYLSVQLGSPLCEKPYRRRGIGRNTLHL